MIETDRHTIYLACSWQPRHEALNIFVARKLANEHGFLLVGDHQGYRRIPHPRGLNFRDRVDEVLGDCSGMVAILPKRDSPQTTTPNIFVELLLAIQRSIPVLLICEEGVLIARSEEAGVVTLRFGSTVGSRRTATVQHVSPNSYDLDHIRNSDTLDVGNPVFLNRPLMLPHDPLTQDEVLGSALAAVVTGFANSFIPQRSPAFVFIISRYEKEPERRVIAHTVLKETGLACRNGSDSWGGAPYGHVKIADKIRNARFVIADLSENSGACVFETGLAVGAATPTFIVTSTPKQRMTYGPDKLPRIAYHNLNELEEAVRTHCLPYLRRVFNFEIADSSGSQQQAATTSGRKRLVLLIHGIRTQAEWQEMVKSTLGRLPDTVVEPVKYGYLDVVRFWIPIFTRNAPIRVVRWKVEAAIAAYPDRDVTVIAHSFGTYAISRLLREDATFRPQRLILCGSIIRRNFRWDRINSALQVVNECGRRDIWPVLATGLTFGYGPSGTFGFGTPGVHDRFHDFSHSEYFNQAFVEQYWKPFVYRGTIVGRQFDSRKHPIWMSQATTWIFRLALVFAVLALLWVAVWPGS